MTVRELRLRNWAWIVPSGALVASLALPGTEVSARTGTAIAGSPGDQVQRASATQGQAVPPPAAPTGRRPGGDPTQGPRQPFGAREWWNEDAIKKEVGLSDEKVRKISEIYQDRMRQMKPSADEWLKQFDLLERMTAERVADDATYSIQVNRLESLGMRLRESRTLMLYRIYKVLQPDQYQRLRAVFDRERSSDRGGRGRGSFPHTR